MPSNALNWLGSANLFRASRFGNHPPARRQNYLPLTMKSQALLQNLPGIVFGQVIEKYDQNYLHIAIRNSLISGQSKHWLDSIIRCNETRNYLA